MPAVTLNQMAANTGAVVRNFFMTGVLKRLRRLVLPRTKPGSRSTDLTIQISGAKS